MMALSELDMEVLNGWVGRSEVAEDTVTPGLIERFRATLGPWLFRGEQVDTLPLGGHWCLAPPSAPLGALGPDGHPERGGFLPPVPFENRMWAGGALSFHGPVAANDRVVRASRIAKITPKRGRSGPLVFVSVEHAYHVGDRLAVEERQDLVYRPLHKSSVAKGEGGEGPGPADAFTGDPVTLFRYSALTFNGHRIHYDYPYATREEGYAGLVVHGPLQATLLMNAAAERLKTGALRFEYRGLAPLIVGQPVSIDAEDDRLWLKKSDGTITFESRYQYL
ncbi:FAS1-like dehydratase domain-containing protein [Notoacmeibacter ruber]|uniref:Protein dehydratase n=1 Tax=Notoacmeibacter ruber TaxID=2670375 RepID=A0A3L7JHE6_9HYPH|nr:MaoC family dehydratase N-terminal domain-containing protein [Notoacmeibacter ruber]RLQ87912.1 protein dehydratase [Notoacmeibacter ruber]